MKYLFQFARIMGFCFLGEVLRCILPLPIPSSIYGLVLLLAALKCGIVKLGEVKECGNFLTGIFPLLFIPAACGCMELWDVIAANWLPILIALVPVTILVMASAGRVTQAVASKKEENSHV